MSVYRRGKIWWYKFRFAGQMIRESTKSASCTVARDAERARRRDLEQSFNRIEKPRTAQLFSVAAEAWLSSKTAHLAPRSVIIERANLKHLNPFFGKLLLYDIGAGHCPLSGRAARTEGRAEDSQSRSGYPARHPAKESPLGHHSAGGADDADA